MSKIAIDRAVIERALDALKNSTIGGRSIQLMHKKGLTVDALRAALDQTQPDPTPYLYYDPENGDTWTQEAINDGCCLPDGLIALYTK